MKIDELIRDLKHTVLHLPWSQIRKGADEVVGGVVATLEAQQGRIEELEAELKEEIYRHDRVQDFEVAEAQVLARVKGQLDEAIRELQYLSVCSTCSKNGTVCHVGMPVAEKVVCCGGYRWRGAKLEPPEEAT